MTGHSLTHDLLIVGAGTVGLSLALALRDSGLRIAVVDARPAGAARGDARVLALSWGSHQILQRLGVWNTLTPHATAIGTIHVSQRGGLGRTLIHAQDYRQPALGYVVPAGQLASALEEALHAGGAHGGDATRPCPPGGIELFHQQTVTRLEPQHDRILLHTASGLTLSGQLCACAEGAISDTQAIDTRDYQQHALIATAQADLPTDGTAYERFTADGPVALLPYGRGYAVVHTTSPQEAARCMALSDDDYLCHLQTHFGARVRLSRLSERGCYPLGLRFRRDPVGARTVWLGNAAQTLHPVAGQGYNLAARDVWALASLLLRHDPCQHGDDLGAASRLADYRAARQLDRLSTVGFTDSLVRLFSNDHPLLHHARGAGLLALDLTAPLRHVVAKRMMFGARAWP